MADEEQIETAAEASQEPLDGVQAEVQEESPAGSLLDDAAQTPDDGGGETFTDPIDEAPRPTLSDEELFALAKERNIRVLDEDEERRIRQSAQDQLRSQQEREAGKRDNVRKAVSAFLKRHDVSVEDSTQLDYLYEIARGNAAYELATEFPTALMSQFDIPADVREQAIAARESGNLDRYVKTLVDGAVASELKKAEADMEKRVQKLADEKLAAEIKARKLEANPRRESAPVTPRGSSATPGLQINDMSDADAAYGRGEIDGTQYRQYREQFKVSLVPGGGR